MLTRTGANRDQVADDQAHDAHGAVGEEHRTAAPADVVGRRVDQTSLASSGALVRGTRPGVGGAYSWTSSIRVPNADFGGRKATGVPRLPGPAAPSLTGWPSAF